jgi:hypothetical protein
MIISGSARFLLKKSIQTEIFLKKPKPVQTDRFRFGPVRFFRTKTGSNRFDSIFSVLARFFFGLGLIRFFWFQAYKTETEPVCFFKILIGLISFFHGSVFFGYFFYGFLGLIDFQVFFLTATVFY